ncbi:MAG: hypothetical protein JNK64_04740 [Myxococcales bacterium]|nr:hypothetical protein [Myxococcales bacterium]
MKQLGVVAFAVVLGACSKQAPKPMDPNQDPASRAAVEKLEGFRAQVCACEDKACADGVRESREAWLAASYGSATLSAEQQRARDAANAAFTECGAKAATPKVADAAQAIVEMAALRDQMCACKDRACADQVAETFAAMGEKYKDTKATETQIKEATKIAEAYGTCMATLYNAAP